MFSSCVFILIFETFFVFSKKTQFDDGNDQLCAAGFDDFSSRVCVA